MHSTNYYNSLITVAEDCKTLLPRAPEKEGTVAALQFDAIMNAPYSLTSDEVIWQVEKSRKPETPDFASYFAQGRACLRCSPLVKSFGWGIHSDEKGRVALVGHGTDAYDALLADDKTTKVAGMRSSRA